MNARRQPKASPITLPNSCPAAPPSSIPAAKMACARDLVCRENAPEIMDCPAGAYAASPTPTKARAARSIVNVVAMPLRTVAAPAKITPKEITRVRLQRSANNPKGMLATASTACRTTCNKPSCALDAPNSPLSKGTRGGTTPRSAKLTKLIKASTASTRSWYAVSDEDSWAINPPGASESGWRSVWRARLYTEDETRDEVRNLLE